MFHISRQPQRCELSAIFCIFFSRFSFAFFSRQFARQSLDANWYHFCNSHLLAARNDLIRASFNPCYHFIRQKALSCNLPYFSCFKVTKSLRKIFLDLHPTTRMPNSSVTQNVSVTKKPGRGAANIFRLTMRSGAAKF